MAEKLNENMLKEISGGASVQDGFDYDSGMRLITYTDTVGLISGVSQSALDCIISLCNDFGGDLNSLRSEVENKMREARSGLRSTVKVHIAYRPGETSPPLVTAREV